MCIKVKFSFDRRLEYFDKNVSIISMNLLFSGIWLFILTVFLTYYWIAVASHYLDIQDEEAKQSPKRPTIQINL